MYLELEVVVFSCLLLATVHYGFGGEYERKGKCLYILLFWMVKTKPVFPSLKFEDLSREEFG